MIIRTDYLLVTKGTPWARDLISIFFLIYLLKQVMCSRLRYYSKFPCIMAKNEINTGMNKDIPQDFFLYVTCNTEIFILS